AAALEVALRERRTLCLVPPTKECKSMFHKALIGGALTIATITGGALGSSFIGVAHAQTADDATTTTVPSTSDTTKNPDDCPLKDGAPAASTDSAATSS